MNAYQEIYEQYFIEASLLWVLRSIVIDQPHYFETDIQQLEQRIEAHLDGLSASIEETWGICVQGLELAEPGEVFTSAVIAFRSHDVSKIQLVIEVGLSNKQAVKGLVSALGWLPGKLVHGWVKKFLTSKDFNHKYLAVAACSVRRENPGEYLNRILDREDCRDNQRLYARSLRIIGEIRRQDLMPYLDQAINSEDKGIRFWALWSSVLLGNHSIVEKMEAYVFKSGLFQDQALNLVFRVLPLKQARNWIAKLAENKNQARNVIKATGILGDPHAVNWLITRMEDPKVARLAGEAFNLITGIELEQNQLSAETINDVNTGPDESPENEDVSMDEDENLPWPDYQEVKRFWMTHGSQFIAGQRYCLGNTISTDFLKSRLTGANQRQRKAAALELALIDSAMPLLNYKQRVG